MFPPQKKALAEALKLVIEDGEYSDKVLEKIAKANRKFGARDRRQLAEALYNLVRGWRRYSAKNQDYEEIIEFYLKGENPSVEGLSPAEALSINDELYERLVEELGLERTPQIIQAMDQQADVFLRVNTLKTNLNELKEELEADGYQLEIQDEPTRCLKLTERKNLFISKAFQEGKFEVQDAGSQALAKLLDPQPGQRVIDACAGAGGKALQMAAMMKNKGKIVAMDIHQWKLNELRKRARRAGVDIIEAKPIENSKIIKRQKNTADKLLLDVPCTGTGVIRRKPDTKLKYTKAEHEALIKTQEEILNSYSKMLKVGGQMLYATCSVFPSENEWQIHNFLKTSESDWKFDTKLIISPDEMNSDGFFAALLTKQS